LTFCSDPTVPCNQPSTSTRTVPLAVHTRTVPLAVHTLTSSLILPSSHPSSLQVYSPFTSKLIYELEVSPSNKISRRDERPLEPCYIEHTSISSSGDWLASVDCRDRDDGIRGESYLKIWRWDRKIDQWILNTRIDRPHGLQKVTCLAFSPAPRERQSIRLVSTGEDGDVKIWGLRAVKDRSGSTEGLFYIEVVNLLLIPE
jgi:NET1-associated nuclear protein 1 (U3 small nucleolar RNA-associated protein 17)